jgi:hypothetical protein
MSEKRMKDCTPEEIFVLRGAVYSGDIGLGDVADQLCDERGIDLEASWDLLRATYQFGEWTEEGIRYQLSDGTTITKRRPSDGCRR